LHSTYDDVNRLTSATYKKLIPISGHLSPTTINPIIIFNFFLKCFSVILIRQHSATSMRNQFKPVFSIPLYSIIIGCLFFTMACSKDPAIPSPPSSSPRKVLIETFTGHRDGHGTIVSDTLQHIQLRHPHKVIGITIHSGYYAKVFPAPFSTDLHCGQGDAYYQFLGVMSNPEGTVNRIGYPDKVLKNYSGEWTRLTDSILALPAMVTLKITNQYHPATRVLNTSVQCHFLSAGTGFYKLVVLLTEDSIIAPQKDYTKPSPGIVLDYAHRHVLRDGITGSWGDLLNTGLITAGDDVIKSYTYTLPADFNGMPPRENQCHVIAYLYDAATYEVLQVEEMKLMDW
jgi:hypothetical protein